jgi:hypothetical protein
MNDARKINVPVGLRRMNLLDTPIWNKGTAFDEQERAAFGLGGRAEHVGTKWDRSESLAFRRLAEPDSDRLTGIGDHCQ